MTKHIFGKEIREMMRDKRVFYGAIVGPVFLVALMVFLIGMIDRTLGKKEAIQLHVVSKNQSLPILNSLKEGDKFRIKFVEDATKSEEMVKDGSARIVLVFPDDFQTKVDAGKPAVIDAVIDGDDVRAQVTMARVQEAIQLENKEKVIAVFQKAGVSPEMLVPVRLESKPIKKKEQGAGSAIAGFLPYLIVLWAFYGAMSIAADMVAGEKERQTLETLLISPATRAQIALGKFWALFCVGLSSSLSSLVTVLVMGLAIPSVSKVMFPTGFSISVGAGIGMIAVIVPLVMMFAGLLLAISAYARNTREAQTYLTMVSFLVLMPAIFSQFIGFTDFAKADWVAFVPVLNAASVLRDALLGTLDFKDVVVTFLTSVVLAVVAVWAAVRMFSREKVLVRI